MFTGWGGVNQEARAAVRGARFLMRMVIEFQDGVFIFDEKRLHNLLPLRLGFVRFCGMALQIFKQGVERLPQEAVFVLAKHCLRIAMNGGDDAVFVGCPDNTGNLVERGACACLAHDLFDHSVKQVCGGVLAHEISGCAELERSKGDVEHFVFDEDDDRRKCAQKRQPRQIGLVGGRKQDRVERVWLLCG